MDKSADISVKEESKITKSDINKVLLRAQLNQFSHNYERMQSLGFTYAMEPVLKKMYKDRPKKEKVNSLKRHLQFFNSHPTLIPFILGVTIAMEENTEEDEKDSVLAVRTALMGPLAGIGDSLLNFTWFPIAGSIGAAFALKGSILGPILMFLIINALYFPLKYYGIHLGYSKGKDLLNSGVGKSILDRVTNAANVIGVMVVSALVVNTVSVNLNLSIGSGKSQIVVQSMLDSIIPSLLPVGLTFFCYWFIKKYEGKHIVPLILGILVLGVLLTVLGILK